MVFIYRKICIKLNILGRFYHTNTLYLPGRNRLNNLHLLGSFQIHKLYLKKKHVNQVNIHGSYYQIFFSISEISKVLNVLEQHLVIKKYHKAYVRLDPLKCCIVRTRVDTSAYNT